MVSRGRIPNARSAAIALNTTTAIDTPPPRGVLGVADFPTLDAEAGRQAGDYLRRFRKSHGVELGDALIAAGALANNAALWTRNRKHYPMKELSFF